MSVDPISGSLKAKMSKSKRWSDMYRKLHILFFNEEFIHKKDYERTINQLNTRITTLETTLVTAITTVNANISIAIAGHTHIAPQAPSGAIPTAPGIGAPAVLAPPIPTVPVVVIHPEQIAHNLKLFAQGPAAAPIDTGSLEGAAASLEVVTDIGI
jgi:hypothetical protein